jgi:hypothetical protein
MFMRLNFTCILFSFLIISCKGPGSKHMTQDSLSAAAKDSGSVASVSGSVAVPDEGVKRELYVERGRLDLAGYSVVLAALYLIPDGRLEKDSNNYFERSYIMATNKARKTTDTMEVGIDDMSRCKLCQTFMRDLTDSLHLPSLTVQVVTPAEDVYYLNTFIGYRDGRLQELFKTEDTDSSGVHIHRKDESTLSYFTAGRDNVVSAYENDYPEEVDLKTFKVTSTSVDKRYIGFRTVAIEEFKAHRVINGLVDASLFKINAGDPLLVDTLYYPTQKVRLLIADSVLVEVKAETARKKVQHLIAG